MTQLPVPHLTQNGNLISNDCSQACATMLIHAYTDQKPTVLDVARATGTADGKPKSLFSLMRMALHYGIDLNIELRATLDWHRRMIDEGKPTIPLVHYGYLNPPHAYNEAHFVVVYGRDDKGFFVHDPLQSKGGWHVPYAVFSQAISTPSPISGGFNAPFQALFPLEALTMNSTGIAGVNIEPRFQKPPMPSTLKGFGYVRFPLIVQEHKGEALEQALTLYKPYIEAYAAVGIRSMVVLTHQCGLEGKGFNWEAMSPSDWTSFRGMYVSRVRQIAQALREKGVVYQVMNEMDSLDPRASVIIPPIEYGLIFREAYNAIKEVESAALVIVGGYNSGADRAKQQFTASGIKVCDGVALHPYGVSANADFGWNGSLKQNLDVFASLKHPLWITEYGCLGQHAQPEDKIARYADAFMKLCKSYGVRGAIWYAWSDGMDSGDYQSYGVAKTDGSIRQKLFDALTSATVDAPPVQTPNAMRLVNVPSGGIRLRANPSTAASIVTVLHTGADVLPYEEVQIANGYRWRKVKSGTSTGWIAVEGPQISISLKL